MFNMRMRMASAAAVAAIGVPFLATNAEAIPLRGPLYAPEIGLAAVDYTQWQTTGDGNWHNIVTGQITGLPPSFGNFDHLLTFPSSCYNGLPCDVGAHTPPLNPGLGDLVSNDGGVQYLTFVLTILIQEARLLDMYDGLVAPLVQGLAAFLNSLDPSQTLSALVVPMLSSVLGIPGTLMLSFNNLLLLPFNLGVGAGEATLPAEFVDAALGGHLDGATIDLADGLPADIDALAADGSFVPDLAGDPVMDVPDDAVGDLLLALS